MLNYGIGFISCLLTGTIIWKIGVHQIAKICPAETLALGKAMIEVAKAIKERA